MLDIVTTLLEIAGLLFVAAATFVAVAPFGIALALLATGVALFAQSAVLTRWGGR